MCEVLHRGRTTWRKEGLHVGRTRMYIYIYIYIFIYMHYCTPLFWEEPQSFRAALVTDGTVGKEARAK